MPQGTYSLNKLLSIIHSSIIIRKLSYFGRNIKKIRTVKKLSQAAFAELFSLKRGSIGAYEEGRAEAKIDTIINIAAYFKLSLEQLLTGELTINEIYHIDTINKKLYDFKLNKNHIPFVSTINQNEFIHNYNNNNFLENLHKISLPYLKQNNIAFESVDSSMLGMYSGIKQGDILITQLIKFNEIEYLTEQSVILVLYENKLVMGIPELKKGKLILRPLNMNYQKYYIKIDSIKRLWQIIKIVSNLFLNKETLENRIQNIENKIDIHKNEISNLKSKI